MFLKKLHNLRQTLTFRLTLWYSLIFTIASSALFLLFYHQVNKFVNELAENELISDLSEYRYILKLRGLDALIDDITMEAEAEGSGRIFFRILSSRGKEIASSDASSWKGLEIDTRALIKINEGANHLFRNVMVQGHTHKVLVMYAAISTDTILQACQSLDENEEHLIFFRNVFIVLMLSVIILASLSVWFMLRRALSGVMEVTRIAMEIEKGEFDRRVSIKNKGSEISNLATAFNRMLDRIDSLIKGMKEISDNIAHDLRSPITGIRGMAEMALTSKNSIEDLHDVWAGTIEECDRLLSMINTMLDISETEAGAAKFIMSDVDISMIVGEAIDLFQPMAEEKEITIISDIEEKCYIRGDLQKLQRMVSNIIDNAIKYTGKEGEVSISVTKGESVEISITDSGIGINKEDLPRIFERFYRGDKSRSKPGIGLGLSLARAIAKAHGGDILAISPPDKGCTFIILIPSAESLYPPTPRPKLTKR